jgi:hypothetical protein
MACAAAASFAPGTAAGATNYTFIKIADSAGQFSTFAASASINDSGQVAFFATLDAGGGGIYVGKNGSITPIATTAGPYSALGATAGINNSGTVAFHANFDAGGSGILTSSGGTVTNIALTSGPYSGFSGAPSINNSGTVAFKATLDAGGTGIFKGDGGPVDTIAHTSGPYSNFANIYCINDSGTVAFHAQLDNGDDAIYAGNGGALSTIADTSGQFSNFGDSTASPLPLGEGETFPVFWRSNDYVLLERHLNFGRQPTAAPSPSGRGSWGGRTRRSIRPPATDIYPGQRLLRSLAPGYYLSPRWGFQFPPSLCFGATGGLARPRLSSGIQGIVDHVWRL